MNHLGTDLLLQTLLYWNITWEVTEQVKVVLLLSAQMSASLHFSSWICSQAQRSHKSSLFHDPNHLEDVLPKFKTANFLHDMLRQIQMRMSRQTIRGSHIVIKRYCKERLMCY
jgi:hypothetical protein